MFSPGRGVCRVRRINWSQHEESRTKVKKALLELEERLYNDGALLHVSANRRKAWRWKIANVREASEPTRQLN